MRAKCILPFVLIISFVSLLIGGCGFMEKINVLNDSENGDKTEALISANKEFSWDIFKKLNEEDSDKEIFISPLSISSMLTMALNGAEGATRQALIEGLRYDGISIEELNGGYSYLIDRISNIDEKVDIEIANSIWIRNGFDVKQNFIDNSRNFLNAEVESLDFSDLSAPQTINDWIARKTGNLITNVINPPINADVMMYLINAIYFKGEWTEAFKKKDTFETDFYAYDNSTDKVSMMQRTGKIEYCATDDYQAVRLPYGNEKTGMVVILPKDDINKFINKIDHNWWNDLLGRLSPVRDLNLKIPKFKMEYGVKELKKSLAELGMGLIFTDSADFSGIAKDLYISRVLHKAVVDVNEEGTEAAAVTVGEFTITAIREPVSFIANRPFIFIITDNEEGNILFMGKKLYGDR
ncbi:MAG: serpin family protein [Clostridiaceae bacterium]|jgi:serine protease inhibitor|nr:serpin family protein [Clostridiaceae bacterium]